MIADPVTEKLRKLYPGWTKKISRNKHGEGCVLRKKLVIGSVQSQKHLTIPSQITLRINVYPRLRLHTTCHYDQ
jgi:hypothetical protein